MKKKVLVLTIIMVLSLVGIASANYDNTWVFGDITRHWAREDIAELARADLVKGSYVGSGEGMMSVFLPEDNITIEEFWAILSRILTKKFGTTADKINNIPVYLDEPMKSQWSYKEYRYLAKYLDATARSYSINDGLEQLAKYDDSSKGKKGHYGNLGYLQVFFFINGHTTFDKVSSAEIMMKYRQPITREQAAAIMGIFLMDADMTDKNVLKAEDWLETRTTAGVNSSYRPYINELVERGMFTGVVKNGKTYVYPKNKLTRAEAATLLNRFRKNINSVD